MTARHIFITGSDSGTSFGSAKFKFTMPDPSIASSPGNTSQHDESYDPEEEVEDHVQFQVCHNVTSVTTISC